MWTWTGKHLQLQSAKYYPRTPCSMIFCSHFSFFPGQWDLDVGIISISISLKKLTKVLIDISSTCLKLFELFIQGALHNTHWQHSSPSLHTRNTSAIDSEVLTRVGNEPLPRLKFHNHGQGSNRGFLCDCETSIFAKVRLQL